MTHKRIALVAPAFNEGKMLKRFLDGAVKTKLPIYLVDDGSEDTTSDVAHKYPIQVLRHRINLGKGAAMKTGAEAAFKAGYDAVVFVDTDGQHDLADLPQFVKKLNAGFDLVYGTRNMDYGVPLVRYMGNKVASLLVSTLFGIYVSDLLCGFRGLTKKAYDQVKWESTGYAVETEMVIRSADKGIRRCEVPVATVYLDKFKGVSLMDAIGIFISVLKWRLKA